MAKVLVETSARHLHLSQQDLETLFGEGFELTFKKALSQPGQFATNEKVEVIGPKKSMGIDLGSRPRPQADPGRAFHDRRPFHRHRPLRAGIR